jgi:hypothetical protein
MNVCSLSGRLTWRPELRRLHDQLLIQSTLSEDAVKHPGTLKR